MERFDAQHFWPGTYGLRIRRFRLYESPNCPNSEEPVDSLWDYDWRVKNKGKFWNFNNIELRHQKGGHSL